MSKIRKEIQSGVDQYKQGLWGRLRFAWLNRSMRAATEALRPDEIVIAAAPAIAEGASAWGVAVLTNQRVVHARAGLVGGDVNTFSLSSVDRLEVMKRAWVHSVSFKRANGEFRFRTLKPFVDQSRNAVES